MRKVLGNSTYQALRAHTNLRCAADRPADGQGGQQMTQRPSGAVAQGVSAPRHDPSPLGPAPLPPRVLRPLVPLVPPGRPRRNPTALGFIRSNLSDPRLDRNTTLIISAATSLRYYMLHIVRMWPEMAPNVLQLIVEFAQSQQVSALIVPDLEHVDHRPGLRPRRSDHGQPAGNLREGLRARRRHLPARSRFRAAAAAGVVPAAPFGAASGRTQRSQRVLGRTEAHRPSVTCGTCCAPVRGGSNPIG